ncbi:hypothetical protein [Nonomuraea bangladeshensis]
MDSGSTPSPPRLPEALDEVRSPERGGEEREVTPMTAAALVMLVGRC